jgi:hypothetical protein
MKTLFALLLSFSSFAQIATGEWRLHVSSSSTIDIVGNSEVVYAAFKNGLMEYDIASGDKNSWNKVNSLSDISLTCLYYSENQEGLFIGYENGNIDYLKNNKVINIPALKLADVIGDKRINKIVEHDGLIYLATGFAILVIDPIKLEVKDTYYPSNNNLGIEDITFINDTIYALTSTHLLKGDFLNDPLADYSKWESDTRLTMLSNNQLKYKDIELVDDELYVLKCSSINYGEDSVFCITNTGLVHATDNGWNLEIYSLGSFQDQLVVNIDSGVLFFQKVIEGVYTQSKHCSVGGSGVVNSVVISDNLIWMGDNYQGGVFKYENGQANRINISGPPKNDFYKVKAEKGKVVVAGGGLDSKFMTYNQSGIYFFENETWELKNKYNMDLWSDKDIWDFVSVAINPKNTDQIAIGCYSPLPLSIIENGVVTEIYTGQNSEIQVSQSNQATLISDLKYDSDGNLWLVNNFSDNPLKVLKADKTWQTYSLMSSISDKVINQLEVDKNDNKWLVVPNVGVIAFTDNGTLSDVSDDQIKLINNGENTGALPSNSVTCIAMDLDNELWIGTEAGFAILYNANNVFEADLGEYNTQRIKLDFEDNVEYLLGSTYIKDIEIDGGNRKWIGTASSGIFLISADGTEVLANFTTENSPLISDVIMDLEIDQKTGEMYIVTDKGLISYRVDATAGNSDYDDVVVFPNPVLPSYAGMITIQGIKYDSDIKVTDVAGNLVYKTTSNGGTATWNGKTLDGQRASTGVYLIWTSPNEGKGRKVGKVVVIN